MGDGDDVGAVGAEGSGDEEGDAKAIAATVLTARDDAWGDAGDADGGAGSDDEDARSMMSCGDGDGAAAGSGRETAAAPVIYSAHSWCWGRGRGCCDCLFGGGGARGSRWGRPSWGGRAWQHFSGRVANLWGTSRTALVARRHISMALDGLRPRGANVQGPPTRSAPDQPWAERNQDGAHSPYFLRAAPQGGPYAAEVRAAPVTSKRFAIAPLWGDRIS